MAIAQTQPAVLEEPEPPVPVTRLGRRSPVLAFLGRRVGAGALTLLAVSALIFTATNILPGNVAELVLGRNATPDRVAALNHQLGFDAPLLQRYWDWLTGILHGDFGDSAVAVALGHPDTSVSSTLASPLTNSLTLAVITAVLLVPLTLLLGMIAGIYAGKALDHVISLPSLVLGGLPEFVTGTLLVFVFFSQLHLLPPVSTLSDQAAINAPKALVLPVLTLLLVALGAGIRQVRAGMIEVLETDYVFFARLNGVRRSRVILRYGLRNAMAPAVQMLAQNLQYLLGGIIVVEAIFAFPGIGLYVVNAVLERDTVKVEAAAIILAAVYTAINILSDLLVVYLVPRLRTAHT
jgi:peptide/nickel transport system permease protein